MAPEAYEQIERQRLLTLARKVEEWQKANGLSDKKLEQKVSQIGSSKTYRKILKEDFSEMDIASQLAEYEAAVAWTECLVSDDKDEENWDEEMSGALKLRSAFNRMRGTSGIARCGFVIGPTGSGKSGSRTVLMRKFGSSLVLIAANVMWRDKPSAFCRALLEELGVKYVPSAGVEMYALLVKMLKEKTHCVQVEEAHHLGPNCLDLEKSLINDTGTSFVNYAVDTLWARMERAAYEQARQLTGNRFAFRITFDDGMLRRDMDRMVTRRARLATGVWDREMQDRVFGIIKEYGRLAFVREMLKRLRTKTGDDTATREDLFAAVMEEKAARETQKKNGGAQ